jgi:cardiolipin synthase
MGKEPLMTDRIYTIPNILTMSRILMTPLVALWLVRQEYRWALWGLLVAGVTDGLDGFIAKCFNQSSRLGAILDPVADKFLMLATVLALTWTGLLPLWVTIPILLRDVVIFGGAVVYYRLAGSIEMSPTILSKANTCAQIVLLLLVVAIYAEVVPAAQILFPAFLVVLVTTVLSGVQYVVIWGRKATGLRRVNNVVSNR